MFHILIGEYITNMAKKSTKSQPEYNGMCVICSRRARCPKAQKLLDLQECIAFKVHPLRGRKHHE